MKKQYIKVMIDSYSSYYVAEKNELCYALDGELDGISTGDKIILEVVEMTEEEFQNLPEFEGW